jgi:hypothetical protein
MQDIIPCNTMDEWQTGCAKYFKTINFFDWEKIEKP